MALVRIGSRRIVVDGLSYRWRVRGRPTYHQGLGSNPLTFAVEQADVSGAVLVVTTDQPHPGNWLGIPTRPILPVHVADAIRTARARGWTPEKPGTAFLLDRSQGFIPSSLTE